MKLELNVGKSIIQVLYILQSRQRNWIVKLVLQQKLEVVDSLIFFCYSEADDV